MVSSALATFTPLLVVPFAALMVVAVAALLHYARSMPASLYLHPTWIDIDVLSHGCHRCEREHGRQQQNRRCFHFHRNLPCLCREH